MFSSLDPRVADEERQRESKLNRMISTSSLALGWGYS